MTTEVTYHRDGYGPGRPAINVKVHWAGAEVWPPELENCYPGGIGPDEYVEVAFDGIASDFWATAEDMAARYRLGSIEQEGRSGGWLVFADFDPQDMTGDERRAWLQGYDRMRAWVRDYIAAVPARVREQALAWAVENMAERTVTLRAWRAFGLTPEAV